MEKKAKLYYLMSPLLRSPILLVDPVGLTAENSVRGSGRDARVVHDVVAEAYIQAMSRRVS